MVPGRGVSDGLVKLLDWLDRILEVAPYEEVKIMNAVPAVLDAGRRLSARHAVQFTGRSTAFRNFLRPFWHDPVFSSLLSSWVPYQRLLRSDSSRSIYSLANPTLFSKS